MSYREGTTGIEIQCGLTEGQAKVGKLLHAMHLDWLMKWGASKNTMVIAIDGVEREEPLFQAHFVECAPGEHELRVAFYNNMKSGTPLAAEVYGEGKRFWTESVRVVVEPGKVVQAVYQLHDASPPTLSVTGARPA
jgi:hypothetical protein